MNIKTTKKLIIAMVIIVVFMLLVTPNKADAKTAFNNVGIFIGKEDKYTNENWENLQQTYKHNGEEIKNVNMYYWAGDKWNDLRLSGDLKKEFIGSSKEVVSYTRTSVQQNYHELVAMKNVGNQTYVFKIYGENYKKYGNNTNFKVTLESKNYLYNIYVVHYSNIESIEVASYSNYKKYYKVGEKPDLKNLELFIYFKNSDYIRQSLKLEGNSYLDIKPSEITSKTTKIETKIFGKDVSFDITISDSDKDDEKKLTLTYNANGGTGAPDSQEFKTGDKIQLSYKILTRSGYTFLGWASDKGAKEATWGAGEKTDVATWDKDHVLYAVWAPIDSKGDPGGNGGQGDNGGGGKGGSDFTIQYFDGSTEYTNLKKSGSFGTIVTLESAQTKEGYTFKEWNTEPDGTGTPRKAGSSLSVNKTKEIKYYAQWEKTSASKEDDEPKKDDNSSGGLSGLLGKLIDFGTSALPTVVETGMSFINSDTVQKLTESAFGGLSKIIGGITGNSGNIGNSIFSIFSSKKQGNVETPTNTEDVPTENIEDNIQEEKGVKVLYKELNKEVEGSIVNLYVIQLEEDLSIDNEKLGKIIINNKYPINIMQVDNDIFALMGIESGNEGYNYGDGKLYLDEDGKIYKKAEEEYIEIAKFEKTIEGLEEADLEKEENYYILKTEQLEVPITSQDLEKLLSTETNESAGNVEYNDTQDTGANVSGGQSTGFGGLNISGTLSNILSSNLLETGLGMAENFAGTATGLIGGALDKVGEATGATGITGMLKGVVDKAGDLVSNGTVRSVAKGGIDVLKKIGGGLTSMFGGN